jgi:hypothetical protein
MNVSINTLHKGDDDDNTNNNDDDDDDNDINNKSTTTQITNVSNLFEYSEDKRGLLNKQIWKFK